MAITNLCERDYQLIPFLAFLEVWDAESVSFVHCVGYIVTPPSRRDEGLHFG